MNAKPTRRGGQIVYVGHYVRPEDVALRASAPSAVAKMNYVIGCLTRVGFEVYVCSMSRAKGPRFLVGARHVLRPRATLSYFSSPPWSWAPFKFASLHYARLALLLHLLFRRRAEVILVYHSLDVMGAVRAARRMRRFSLILEIEEVYSDAAEPGGLGHKRKRRRELGFLSSADAYILSTSSIEDRLGLAEGRAIVCNGDYSLARRLGLEKFGETDGLVHLVYAGVIDTVKQGAFLALATARHLPSRFHLHVMGFGSDVDLDLFQRRLDDEVPGARVTFHGKLVGFEHDALLQRCDVALAVQVTEGVFNSSSFPSKVLTYLSHGLTVVSVPAPAVVGSEVAECLSFSRDDSPQAIAAAVVAAVSADNPPPWEVLRRLDRQFKVSLAEKVEACAKRS